MKKLDDYIVKEHLLPFLGGLSVLTLIMILDRVFDLLDLFLRKGIKFLIVLKVFILSLPFILALTVPMAALIATLMAFGRLSQDFEVMAMKSFGISLKRMLVGPLVFGFLIFVVMSIFDNTVLPDANHKLKNLLIDIHEKKPVAQIKEGVFTNIDNYLIYVRSKNERTSEVKDVMIQQVLPDGRVRTIFADAGKLVSTPEKIVFYLKNGEIHETEGPREEQYRIVKFTKQVITIPVNFKLIMHQRQYRGAREMSASMLYHRIERLKREIKRFGNTDKGKVKYMRKRISQLWVEIHKKFSIPFAAIAFILMGAPIAVMTRKSGFSTAFGISFLLFMFYYIFLVGGEELADRAIIPPLVAMWFPNILFIGIGLYLLKREEKV